MIRQDTFFRVRATVGAFAVIIGILALWVIAGELLNPRLIYFPSSHDEAATLYAARGPAVTAAQVGIVRGDLWTAAAISSAAPSLFELEPAQTAAVENMRAIANRAARLSPQDPRIWLVMAGLNPRLGGNSFPTAEYLKLSYYTGPNVVSLMPLRLLLAVQSNAIADEELQSLVPLDIQRLLTQGPDQKSAIALAYRDAVPKGREVIAATLEKVDPNLLASIRQSNPGEKLPM